MAMNDVAACHGKDCGKKQTCHRYLLGERRIKRALKYPEEKTNGYYACFDDDPTCDAYAEGYDDGK